MANGEQSTQKNLVLDVMTPQFSAISLEPFLPISAPAQNIPVPETLERLHHLHLSELEERTLNLPLLHSVMSSMLRVRQSRPLCWGIHTVP